MTVAERVDHLDEVLDEFITSVGIEFNKLYNSQMRTEAELRAFREDTQAFKDDLLFEHKSSLDPGLLGQLLGDLRGVFIQPLAD